MYEQAVEILCYESDAMLNDIFYAWFRKNKSSLNLIFVYLFGTTSFRYINIIFHGTFVT